jgi:hypothetical protein
MALDDESPKLSRVGGPSGARIPAALVVLTAILTAIAILKPWNAAPRAAGSLLTAPPLSPTATIKASDPAGYIAQPGRMYPQCYATAGWRVAALQSAPDFEVRTVWPVAFADSQTVQEALAAARPLSGGEVKGIGYCAPGSDEETRIAYTARVTLWQADGAGNLSAVEGAPAVDQDLADLGEVYLAPPSAISTDGLWPAGRYVFKVDLGGGSATWFALEITGDETPGQSGAPTVKPSPSVHPMASGESYGRGMSH